MFSWPARSLQTSQVDVFLSPVKSKPLSDVSVLLVLWASFCVSSSISDLPWGSGLTSLLVLCPQCSFWLSHPYPEVVLPASSSLWGCHHRHLELRVFPEDPSPSLSTLLCPFSSILVSSIIIICQTIMLAPSESSSL